MENLNFRFAQIQPEFCDWCQGGAGDLVYNPYDPLVGGDIDGDKGIMTFYVKNKTFGFRKINYCPMCGRRLGSLITKINRDEEVLAASDRD